MSAGWDEMPEEMKDAVRSMGEPATASEAADVLAGGAYDGAPDEPGDVATSRPTAGTRGGHPQAVIGGTETHSTLIKSDAGDCSVIGECEHPTGAYTPHCAAVECLNYVDRCPTHKLSGGR